MHNMRKSGRFSSILVGVLLLTSAVYGQQPVRWEVSLDDAKRAAAQNNRLVLIEFTAPWCSACRAMENEVLSQPAVAAAISANYVPVKVNVEFFPATARQYGVTVLPTTMIIAPTRQGEVLDSMRGKVESREYVERLNRVVASARQTPQPVLAQVGAVPAPAGPGPVSPGPAAMPAMPGPVAGQAPAPPMSPPVGPNVADDGRPKPAAPDQAIPLSPSAPPTPAPANGPPASLGPATPPPGAATASNQQADMPQLPPGSPPLGLDGRCPVRLAELKVWKVGDGRWGARHRGRTYLFAGPEEQRKFMADPDRYAPVHSGEDIVLAIEQGRSVPGARDHGVTYGGHVYLFAGEGTLKRFSDNPRFFADRALQALRDNGPVR
jgi:YHS domain-containing protein/thiol-disulfide isomerase/thioredoxin